MDLLININCADMPNMFAVAGMGFMTVFFVLVLMIGIMKGMGYFFTRQRKVKSVAPTGEVEYEEHAISDNEIVAAIIVALKMYKSDLHDRESEMLTINRITRAYSPWNSKIHGLTQLPKHK
ncbi:MAG: OadG family protein [Alistipes sp.]|nr:OadG family protein [Alistipes sp.]